MSTTRQKTLSKGTAATDPGAAQRLLDEAMKQPGVRDMMEAYGEAKRYQDAAAAYQSVLSARTVEWASDSTTPEYV